MLVSTLVQLNPGMLQLEKTQRPELIQLKHEARLKRGFYVIPKARMLFISRIRGRFNLGKAIKSGCILVMVIGRSPKFVEGNLSVRRWKFVANRSGRFGDR